MADNTYEIILYGATGFTGKLTAAYLDTHPALAGKRWAIAGRNPDALQAVKDTLNSQHVETIACPLTDPDAVADMVRKTKVVITTAGPFSTYNGDVLLGACAQNGIHYSDLSGEGFWQREMIDTYHEDAIKTGAKIVLGGGVDSIPSDLGAYMAVNALGITADDDVNVEITGIYTRYTGSISGGTLASGIARRKAMKDGRVTVNTMRDPYLLVPGFNRKENEEPTLDGFPHKFSLGWNARFGLIASFFMGAINAPVVRRSIALKGLGRSATYREACTPGMFLKNLWLWSSRGFGYFVGDPINFAPKPGEGPPKWMQKRGGFTIKVDAITDDGRIVRAVIKGKGDPGYGATSKMLSELGLCLADDSRAKPDAVGVITPWTALGDALVDQLQSANGGKFMSLTVK